MRNQEPIYFAPQRRSKTDQRGLPIRQHVFESKFVKSDGCWVWIGATNSGGYGSYGKRNAHRASYELYNGPIPDGAHVCHSCDNRLCVRPDHLWLGTSKQNMQDCKNKGRMKMPPRYVGSGHPEAKMNEDKVRAVRMEVSGGMAKRAAARKYGIDRATLRSILEGRTWRHV